MAEKPQDTTTAATTQEKAPEKASSSSRDPSSKKKKSKRSTSSRKDSALSSSARSTGSARRGGGGDGGDGGEGRAGDGKPRRRRSRSTDKGVKARRDSGSRRMGDKERNGSSNNGESSSVKEGWERKGRSATKDGALRGSGGSARHHSPNRARKSKSEGVPNKQQQQQGDSNNNHGKGPPTKDRSRSRSPSRSSGTAGGGGAGAGGAAGHAPRLPQRTVSNSSDLQSALEATKSKQKDREAITKKDSFEEASLGDFRLYAQKQEKRMGGSSLKLGGSPGRQRMGEIPEESLGSFTAFHSKYEQEKLLGLHDGDDGPDVYGQNSTKPLAPPVQPLQETQNNDVSMSLGNLVSQYGGAGTKAQPKKPPVEESLGSFTAFHRNYEQEKLLGLQDSNMSALQQSTPPPPPVGGGAVTNHRKPSIPEESMGDFVQLAAKEEKEKQQDHDSGLSGSRSKTKDRKHDSGGEERWKEYPEIVLPKNRVEKLGKRGGVGYRIMVDTPGGHSPEPMKIVVAVEFDEDDSDSDDSDEDEDEEDQPEAEDVCKVAPKATEEDEEPQKDADEVATVDQAEEINESGHLPLSALSDDDCVNDKPHDKPLQNKKKYQGSKSHEAAGKAQRQHPEVEEEEDHSEAHDEVGPLTANMNRWTNQTGTARAGSPKQPEREKTTSTHSTVSSLTLESALEDVGLPIHDDSSPSNHSSPPRRPGSGVHRGKGLNAALRRPSGAVPAGGTATLLKRPSVVAPHNLGTRRGLMLRQQSEASMMSTGTSKSNDSSSWTGQSTDLPQEYQASFMQLNLVNLEKTEMQTNEEVEQAELPDALRSGVEGIEDTDTTQHDEQTAGTAELEPIPEGKDPKIAASELLGMKTMLKHIRRAAPKRSKSFEFDRDMPKQMWNKMFASKRGELAGSQYVDNDESTGHDEDDNIHSTRSTPEAFRSSNRSQEEGVTGVGAGAGTGESKSMTAGLFSTIKKVTGTGPSTSSKPAENSSGSKGKASLWSSTIGSVIPSTKKSKPEPDESGKELTEKTNDEGSEASMELDGILAELDKSLAHHLNASAGDVDPAPGRRRDESDKGNDGSGRAAKSGRTGGSAPRKGGTARNRAARAQHVHNRSLRDTIDYYTAEQEDDELPQLETMNEDEAKRKPRVRNRRKGPNRTKSDEGTGRGGRAKMDGSSRVVHRTRSQDGSPTRAARDTTKKMHASFSGIDPSDAPPIRRQGTKTREAASGQQDSGDGPPSVRRQGTKSREGPSGKDVPSRTRSHDKGVRGSGRKQRPQRKKSAATGDDHEAALTKRGAELPEGATEEEIRELLGYD